MWRAVSRVPVLPIGVPSVIGQNRPFAIDVLYLNACTTVTIREAIAPIAEATQPTLQAGRSGFAVLLPPALLRL